MNVQNAIKNCFCAMTLNELRLMNHSLLSRNISYNTLLYLDIISFIDNCTGAKLADILGISRAAVTIKVKELIGSGLITKRQSEKDKRIFYLENNKELNKINKIYDKSIFEASELIKKSHTEEELHSFCTILMELTDIYAEKMVESAKNRHIK